MTPAAYGISVLVGVVGALTLLGLFDRSSPYLELLTFFRLQYAALLIVAALVAFLLRLVPVTLLALLLAGVNVLVISQVALAPETASPGSARLRALIVNVAEDNSEYDRVEQLVAETDPDVVGVTELTPAWVRGLESPLKGFRHRRLEPQEGAYGVGLYSKLPLAASRIERFPSEGPPSVVATVALGRRPLGIVVTHVRTPFAGEVRFRQLRALGNELQRLEDRLIVCGDFNAVPWSQPIRDLAEDADLRSVYGRFGLAGTWPANARLLRLPFDNCLVSEGIAVAGRHVGPDIGSDHLPLIVDFALASTPRTHALAST